MQDIAKVATNAVHPKSVARKDAVISFHHLFNDQHHQQRIMYWIYSSLIIGIFGKYRIDVYLVGNWLLFVVFWGHVW